MYTYKPMSIEHYDQALLLWARTPGLGISMEVDSEEGIAAYLKRNPGISHVCVDEEDQLVGTALCGHDGRRGYMYHVVVDTAHRGNQVATTLVRHCLDQLKKAGIFKCHLMVLDNNETGKRYWSEHGWHYRDNILLYSANTQTFSEAGA